jgi:hypothetical protein
VDFEISLLFLTVFVSGVFLRIKFDSICEIPYFLAESAYPDLAVRAEGSPD